jgi:hypothetical protein
MIFVDRVTRRRLLGATLTGLLITAGFTAASAASAYSSYLMRAPYLTDLTRSGVKVNFATTTSIVKVRARYGTSSGGTCTPASTTTPDTAKLGFTVSYPGGSARENQWKVQISDLDSGTYCYRIQGATSTSSTTYIDLLDTSTASPAFKTAASTSFAVIGDWGQTGGTAPSHLNVDQANNISQMANSGAGFAVSTGDIGYPSGSQSNHGDLIHTGPDVSAVFGPATGQWPARACPCTRCRATTGSPAPSPACGRRPRSPPRPGARQPTAPTPSTSRP